MRKLGLVILALFCFGPQFYFGFAGTGVLTPVSWSFGAALFAVGTGWRAAQQNILTSVLIGACYAAAANVPLYLFGRWLGNPATGSIGLTAVVSAIGLLMFGSLALLRRKWPQAPSHDHAATIINKAETRPAADDAFKKFHKFMDSENAQNKRLIEPHRSEVRAGADCDEIVGVVGEFGRDPRNPIPVNGPLGEIIYLSNLRRIPNILCFTAWGRSVMWMCMKPSVLMAQSGTSSFFISTIHENREFRHPATRLSPAPNAIGFCWALMTSLPSSLTTWQMR